MSAFTRLVAVVCLTTAVGTSWAQSASDEESGRSFKVVSRQLSNFEGRWSIDYIFEFRGKHSLAIAPEDIRAFVDAPSISNSSVPGHSVPRPSRLQIPLEGIGSSAVIVTRPTDQQPCHEEGVFWVWEGRGANDPHSPWMAQVSSSNGVRMKFRPETRIFEPGATFRVRVDLEHRDGLWSKSPLFGMRTLSLQFGSALITDEVQLDAEREAPKPGMKLPPIPKDRLDSRFYRSAPHSLLLSREVAGWLSFEFPPMPVRNSTKLRLRFWYYLADEFEYDSLKAEIRQYRDPGIFFNYISEGDQNWPINWPKGSSRWKQFDQCFETDRSAVTLTLRLALSSTDEPLAAWIDDIRLDVVGSEPLAP